MSKKQNKQTGPKTAAGKAKSSRNALKHGLTSMNMYVLDNENLERWHAVLKYWTDKLQPRDEAELMIVEDIAHAQWRIRRSRTIETGMVNIEMADQNPKLVEKYETPIDECLRLASAYKGLGEKSEGLNTLHRYETRARRAFKAGMNALEQLRRMTEQQPPASAAAPQPQPQEPPPQRQQHPPAQQLAPQKQNLPNETRFATRRAAILQLRRTYGDRIRIRIQPPERRKRA